VLEAVGEAKVGDDHVAVSVKEEVFELEVAVHDLLLVDVPHPRDELREELGGVTLFEVSVCEDVVEELAARGVFDDDTDIFVGFDYFV
jgi:hypothetical protein